MSVDAIHRGELDALLEALPAGPYEHVDRALFLGGGFAGLRLGELIELRWGHVDWPQQRILAPGRFVPLADRLGAALDQLSHSAGDAPGRLVFCDPVAGGPLDRRRTLGRLREACARAGVPPPRAFDALRAGFTVSCAEAGVPLGELAGWLGVRLGALEWVLPYTLPGNAVRRIQPVFATDDRDD